MKLKCCVLEGNQREFSSERLPPSGVRAGQASGRLRYKRSYATYSRNVEWLPHTVGLTGGTSGRTKPSTASSSSWMLPVRMLLRFWARTDWRWLRAYGTGPSNKALEAASTEQLQLSWTHRGRRCQVLLGKASGTTACTLCSSSPSLAARSGGVSRAGLRSRTTS